MIFIRIVLILVPATMALAETGSDSFGETPEYERVARSREVLASLKGNCVDLLSTIALVSTRDNSLNGWFKDRLRTNPLQTEPGSYDRQKLTDALVKSFVAAYGGLDRLFNPRNSTQVLNWLIEQIASKHERVWNIHLPTPLFVESTLSNARSLEDRENLDDYLSFLRRLKLVQFEFLFLVYVEAWKVTDFLLQRGLYESGIELAVDVHNSFETILRVGFTETSLPRIFPGIEWNARLLAELEAHLADPNTHAAIVDRVFEQADQNQWAVATDLDNLLSLSGGIARMMPSRDRGRLEALRERLSGREFYGPYQGKQIEVPVPESLQRLPFNLGRKLMSVADLPQRVVIPSAAFAIAGMFAFMLWNYDHAAEEDARARLRRSIEEDPSLFEKFDLEPHHLGFEDENDPELQRILNGESR